MYNTLHLNKLIPLVLLFILNSLLNIFAQKYPTGAQITNYRSAIDDSDQPYGLYLPPNYNPNKKYPLVIMLHGAGSNHVLAMKRIFGLANNNLGTDVELSRNFETQKISNHVDFIVATPLARGTMGYQNIAEHDVLDVLHDVKKRFSVDENRQYLTGYSMGGGGSFWIGLTYPHYWAAIAPVCPSVTASTFGLEKNINQIPIKLFQGEVDPLVKKDSTLKWVERFKNIGAKVEYQEYPKVSHNSWENAYANGQIFDWFKGKVRNPFPSKVSFATRELKHNTAYWVTINEKRSGEIASIEAEILPSNVIMIQTKNVQRFTLNLAKHPRTFNNKNIRLIIDNESISKKDIFFTKGYFIKTANKWTQVENGNLPSLQKQIGFEGPIAEAMASSHIYVYGTADNPKPEILKKRIETANFAANWSEYRGDFLRRVMFFPRVVADKDLKPSDYKNSNLIVFGNSKTNLVIQNSPSYSQKIELDSTAQGMGLVFITPSIGENKVMVISDGLAWWETSKTETVTRLNTPMAFNSAIKLKDFIIFKNDSSKLLVEGFLDNNWNLEAKDLEKIKAISGIIVVEPKK